MHVAVACDRRDARKGIHRGAKRHARTHSHIDPVMTRTAFTRSSDASDDNWIDMAVGASVPLGTSVNAFAGVSAVTGNSDRCCL